MNTMLPTQSNKRRRDSDDLITESSYDSTPDPIQPDDLKPFTCSRKVKDMDPDKLLDYFPNLPERTQYFDLGKLVTAKLDHEEYYANSLSEWRRVSAFHFDRDPWLIVELGPNMDRCGILLLRSSP